MTGAPARAWRRASAVPWLCTCAALMLASLLAWTAERTLLDWQPARAWAEPWRWCSAALVHLSALHLWLNLLAAALVAAYGWAARVNAAVTWAWVASMPFTHLALLAQPQLLHYGGLSGVLHGGVAAVSVWLAVRGNGGERTVGWLMLIGQAVKLLLERSWDAALQTPPELDVAVAPLAHASGSLAGALLTLLALRLTRTAQRRR